MCNVFWVGKNPTASIRRSVLMHANCTNPDLEPNRYVYPPVFVLFVRWPRSRIRTLTVYLLPPTARGLQWSARKNLSDFLAGLMWKMKKLKLHISITCNRSWLAHVCSFFFLKNVLFHRSQQQFTHAREFYFIVLW